VERIKVYGAALEGNLENDAVDRDVMVFLPPGYATEKSRRYPVVYALHGLFHRSGTVVAGDSRAARPSKVLLLKALRI